MSDDDRIPTAQVARILRAQVARLESQVLWRSQQTGGMGALGELEATVSMIAEAVAFLLDLHPEDGL